MRFFPWVVRWFCWVCLSESDIACPSWTWGLRQTNRLVINYVTHTIQYNTYIHILCVNTYISKKAINFLFLLIIQCDHQSLIKHRKSQSSKYIYVKLFLKKACASRNQDLKKSSHYLAVQEKRFQSSCCSAVCSASRTPARKSYLKA